MEIERNDMKAFGTYLIKNGIPAGIPNQSFS